MEIKPIVRDANGLITGVDYVIAPDGTIDWRKMVKPEFLVPNKRVFEKNNKPVPETIEGLADNELLILLGGIKSLARLRGYHTVTYKLVAPTPEYVAATCHIDWKANFETEGEIITSGGTADAHPDNTDGFGRMYLAAIAENRAFVRCVRNFLGINIVGQDEVCQKVDEAAAPASVQTSPAGLLEKLMAEKNVSFKDLQSKLVAEKVDGAADFKAISDIPKVKVFELIERLRKKKV